MNNFNKIPRRIKVLSAVFYLAVIIFAANFSFSAGDEFNDRKWNDLEKMPKSLPTPIQKEPKTLPTPAQEDPLKDMRLQEKYRFPKQSAPELSPQPLIIDQQAQDRAVVMNQKRWREMMESDKANLFKRFDEWLEVFHIPREYHLIVELFIVALFIVFLGVMFYKRGLKKEEQDKTFRLPPGQKYRGNFPS